MIKRARMVKLMKNRVHVLFYDFKLEKGERQLFLVVTCLKFEVNTLASRLEFIMYSMHA